MAERPTKKGREPAPRRRSAARDSGGGAGADDRGPGRAKQLERECDRLKEQLAEAHERIARLEQSRAEAVNRIDWVIDSLHNVLEKGA
jgi:hypothetical protein